MRLIYRCTLLYFILLLLFVFFARAADSTAARTISPAEWKQLTADKAFDYRNEVEKIKPPVASKPNALLLLLGRLLNFLSYGFGKIFLWLLIFGLLVLVVFMALRSNENFIFGRSKRQIKEAQGNLAEDDINNNWELLMQKAIRGNDFRQAVRYSYMRLLQLLQEKQLIRYRSDKTNFEYYNELEPTVFKQPFKQLSRKYEYAYYGNYALTTADFNEYIELFNGVRKQLAG